MGTSTVNIAFPDQLITEIDQVADTESRSRSELLREAARQYIERKQRWSQLFRFAGRHSSRRKLQPSDVDSAIAHYRQRARKSR